MANEATRTGKKMEGLAVEDMDDYAPEPEVHKYLHSRWVGHNPP